jgi:hypothetical protein
VASSCGRQCCFHHADGNRIHARADRACCEQVGLRREGRSHYSFAEWNCRHDLFSEPRSSHGLESFVLI